ncbi:MAG: DUF362 domain-containing protein [Ktedonobacteraceae bacterium]|nr:DUF362 domain-containing protein [Ktedonobacteraceae bacterium]
MTLVVITHNEQIEPAIMQALERLPLEQLTRGKVVAVKPNDTWASAQDRTGVTQPDTLRAVLRAIKRFQPRELIVTGGSGAGETDEIFEVAGLMDVVRQEQAVFVDHNRPPFQEIPLTYAADKEVAGPQRTIMVNPRILTYETLIVVSQLKMHSTATVTLALKNIAMSFPAADYYGHPRASHPERHHFMEDMHSFIAAMHHRFPAHLAITVGHPAMVASGPLGGYTAETGLVIASTDTLAADVVGAQILGLSVQAVRHLWEASRLGPGVASISQMEFPVLQLKDAIKIFTRKVYGKELTFEHA